MKNYLTQKNILFWIAKIIFVFVFLYFGIDSILYPDMYAGLVPGFIGSVFPAETLVFLHGGIEILCSLFILFGIGRTLPYVILALSFLGVLVSVSGTILVRDVGIMGFLALLIHVQLKREVQNKN